MIELMMVLAIIAVLGAIAMPSFGGVSARYRLRHASDEMAAAIYLARAEALRRGGNVTFRKASTPDCVSQAAIDWSCGWLVIADAGDDGASGPGGKTIQVWPAPERITVTVRAALSPSQFQINRWGRFGSSQGFSVTLRPAGQDDKLAAVVLCMSSGGRLQSLQRTDRCPD